MALAGGLAFLLGLLAGDVHAVGPGPRAAAFLDAVSALNARIYSRWFRLADTEYHLYLIAISAVDDRTKDNATQELSLDYQAASFALRAMRPEVDGLDPTVCSETRAAYCTALMGRLQNALAAAEQKLELVKQLIEARREDVNYELAAQYSLAAGTKIENADERSFPAQIALAGAQTPAAAFFAAARAQLALRLQLTKLFALAPVLSCTFARSALDDMNAAFDTMDTQMRLARERWTMFEARGPYRIGAYDLDDDANALIDLGDAVLGGMREMGRNVRFWRAKLRESYGEDCRYNGFADFRAFNADIGERNTALMAKSEHFIGEVIDFTAQVQRARASLRR